jgi:hypothetical protein
MTESHRTALLTACAFATTFVKAADQELRNSQSGAACRWREEATEQLRAALRALDTYNPDINRPSTQPYPHIDSDRRRGPSDWDRECQESRRLNR